MANKKVIEDTEQLDEMTPAEKTLQTNPSAATDPSKSVMMAQTIDAMAKMSSNDLSHLLTMALDQIGQESKDIPDNAAENNKASVDMKGDATSAMLPFKEAVKEDVSLLFGSEEISEEFQEKVTTLFEAAVTAHVAQIRENLEEEYQQKLEEEVEQIQDYHAEQIDRYLSAVAEEWLSENEVAVESSIRTEFAESFIQGIRNVFEQHYVNVPEDQVDVVEALSERVEELEEQLNDQINANLEMQEAIEEFTQEEVFDEVAEGLAHTQVDKLRQLTESVEFEGDVDQYRGKLEMIREHYFSVESKPANLHEEVEEIEEGHKPKVYDQAVSKYAAAISKTTKR